MNLGLHQQVQFINGCSGPFLNSLVFKHAVKINFHTNVRVPDAHVQDCTKSLTLTKEKKSSVLDLSGLHVT